VEWQLLAVGIPEEYSVADVRREAARLGVADRVTVEDGRDGPAPYPLADLFALPTHDENFGQVVAESLAWGVPVITTRGTPWGALDAVGAGSCVDLAEFRGELGRLLDQSTDDLRAAGERGRRWVLDTFRWEDSALRLKSLYEELLSRPAALAVS
jgi:glycosyltransferase involved in cell wall biosynthesis